MKKSDWTRMLIEGCVVVLGVFLALLADQWREDRSKNRTLAALLQAIERELDDNLAKVQTVWQPRHRKIEASLKELVKRVENNPEDTLPSLKELGIKGGLSIGHVPLEASWRMLENSGLTAHLDLEISRALAETYAIQNEFSSRCKGSIDDYDIYLRGVYGLEDSGYALQKFRLSWGDFMYYEAYIIETYKNTLAILKNHQ